MSATQRLPRLVQAQEYHARCAAHKAWSFSVLEIAQAKTRTWDSIDRAETELLRATEVERLAQRALRLAEFNYLTFRPLGGPRRPVGRLP